MPKPSVRTVLGLAAVAAAVALYLRRHGGPSSDRIFGNRQARLSQLFGHARSYVSRT